VTRKILLKSIPLFSVTTIGGLVYLFATNSNGQFHDLLINVSASFFAIPLMFFFYDLTRASANKKLNTEIMLYSKLLVDKEVLTIINQLSKITSPYEMHNFSFDGIKNYLKLNKENIQYQLMHSIILGFQVKKNWHFVDKNIKDLIGNSFICQKLENDHVIAIISILKSIRSLEQFIKVRNLYIRNDNIIDIYRIVDYQEMGIENNEHFGKYMLVKDVAEDKFLVVDFGNFLESDKTKLLYSYSLNEEYASEYAEKIENVIKALNKWINIMGNEIVIDMDEFKISINK